MKRSRPAIFRGRHFEPEIITTCVRSYLRFSLSLRNVEEMMAERWPDGRPIRPFGAGVKNTVRSSITTDQIIQDTINMKQ
jgi:hypothetical protein